MGVLAMRAAAPGVAGATLSHSWEVALEGRTGLLAMLRTPVPGLQATRSCQSPEYRTFAGCLEGFPADGSR